MSNGWTMHAACKQLENRQALEPVYTLGNGYLCARGFFEEEPDGLLSYGGTYMAGVFGKARYTPWRGMGRELVNTPNLFAARIFIDGQPAFADKTVQELSIDLAMQTPLLRRSYLWHGKSGAVVKLCFERFISGSDLHTAGQRITVTPIGCTPQISVSMLVNPDVRNLNLVSSEPLPKQPGVRHLKKIFADQSCVVSRISGYRTITLAQGQAVSCDCAVSESGQSFGDCESHFDYVGQSNISAVFTKLVYTYTSLDGTDDPLEQVRLRLVTAEDWAAALAAHTAAWHQKWQTADIVIDGNEDDQATIRYNMLQLMQALPPTADNSIGARGLTGEMYEGCIFWDTEIFMLPFFTYTDPDAARQLLAFRYRTLPEARLHAKNNYFQGAMYGWQVSELGIEQTPQGVGAYYSIHVVADIAYAILEYWNASHDDAFMLESGAEILIETARFWASRVHQNPKSGQYDILAVRGPNEYDVIVNNNLYTNMMAQQNLMFAAELIALLKRDYPAQWSQLSNKLQFAEGELSQWAKICDKLVLAYDAERALYEEDDMYFCRVPLELVKMKTSRKRIIDTTLPYEALMLYQVSKQADVLHVMKNLHWRFTQQQKKNAWEYYLPKTCFDSSLGYCMHAVMAAQIGLREEAYRYYSVCANFDARNMQLNTISGLHFANFGGTWQAVIFGFAGVQVSERGITVTPCLPEQWRSLEFSLCYGGGQLRLTLTHTELAVTLVHRAAQDVLLSAAGQCVVLNAKQSFYRFLLPSNNER